MTLRKIKLQKLIFSIFWRAHSQCVTHLKHFVFDFEVNNPQHEVLIFCQQELLNLPFVKRKTLFLFILLFHLLEHTDFSCPLLQFEKVGNPMERGISYCLCY